MPEENPVQDVINGLATRISGSRPAFIGNSKGAVVFKKFFRPDKVLVEAQAKGVQKHGKIKGVVTVLFHDPRFKTDSNVVDFLKKKKSQMADSGFVLEFA